MQSDITVSNSIQQGVVPKLYKCWKHTSLKYSAVMFAVQARKVYGIRRHNMSLCTQKQPESRAHKNCIFRQQANLCGLVACLEKASWCLETHQTEINFKMLQQLEGKASHPSLSCNHSNCHSYKLLGVRKAHLADTESTCRCTTRGQKKAEMMEQT